MARTTRGKSSRTAVSRTAGNRNVETLAAVLKIFTDADVAELDFEDDTLRIRLARAAPAPMFAAPAPAVAPPRPVADAATGPHAHVQATHTEQKGVEGHIITSPFVGTFYRSPQPGTPAFVQSGSVVKKGQALCIIEAMKLMNEIESDEAGKIAEIYVENGQPVEFGQKLFRIVPA